MGKPSVPMKRGLERWSDAEYEFFCTAIPRLGSIRAAWTATLNDLPDAHPYKLDSVYQWGRSPSGVGVIGEAKAAANASVKSKPLAGVGERLEVLYTALEMVITRMVNLDLVKCHPKDVSVLSGEVRNILTQVAKEVAPYTETKRSKALSPLDRMMEEARRKNPDAATHLEEILPLGPSN